MKIIYKIIMVLLFIPIVTVGNNKNKKGKYNKDKSYQKEYSVSKNALLKINNKFGDINITSWNQNTIKIDVKISVSGNNEQKVISKLDEITVNFSGAKDLVSAVTEIANKNRGWSNTNRLNFDITYVVKVPTTNKIDIYNKYGDISLNELKNKANISCKYGNVDIGNLYAENNDITLKYSNKSVIEKMKTGTISGGYSSVTIGETDNVSIDANYTKAYINMADKVHFEGNYGGVFSEKVTELYVDGNYMKIKVDHLENKMNVDTSYSSIKVENISEGLESIIIDSNYTSVNLNYSEGLGFKFNIDLSYANFKYNDKLYFIESREKNTSKYYMGYVNNKDGASINIVSDYGNVSINKK